MRAAAILSVLLIGACTEEDASWRLTFATSALRANAAVVEASIVEGGCAGSREVFAEEISTDGATRMPPELADGAYGLRGRARDSACRWYASGCAEITVPLESGDAIEVVLRADAGESACSASEMCVAGTCTPRDGDGGMDAGAGDGGAGDAGMRDAASDAGPFACDSVLPPFPPELGPRCEADTKMCVDSCGTASCIESCARTDGVSAITWRELSFDCDFCVKYTVLQCFDSMGCHDEQAAYLCCAEATGCAEGMTCMDDCRSESDALVACVVALGDACRVDTDGLSAACFP